MHDHYAAMRAAIETAALDGEGEIPPKVRREIADGRGPADVRALLEKIERHAYKVTDEDISSLRERYSQDALFEVIVAATLGAARRRIDALLVVADGTKKGGQSAA